MSLRAPWDKVNKIKSKMAKNMSRDLIWGKNKEEQDKKKKDKKDSKKYGRKGYGTN
jgi:hypothetical protein